MFVCLCMSFSYSPTSERRLSSNGNNAYIVVSSPYNNNNTYDPKDHKNYLSVRTTTNERSPLSSAPKQNNCVEDNIKEIIEKQTTTQMVAENSNATVINVTNSSNENINSIKTGDDKKNQSSFTLNK